MRSVKAETVGMSELFRSEVEAEVSKSRHRPMASSLPCPS